MAKLVLHPIGFDDYGHAGLDPSAQRIGCVEAEKAEEIAHAGRYGPVIRRGPDDRVRGNSGFHDTESHTCRHSRNSASVSVAVRERSHALSARAATAKTSRQPFNTSTVPTPRRPALFRSRRGAPS